MIIPLHLFGDEQTSTRRLDCRLRKRAEGRGSGSALAGEIELENISDSPVEVLFRASPVQHLNLIVTDDQGRTVSAGHYGDLFSPAAGERAFRLLPGERFTRPVSFLATVPTHLRLPGVYSIRAVFEADGLRAESSPYTLDWRPEADG